MRNYVNVIDDSPNATKKGLRMKVTGVELDENNNLIALHVDYSEWHLRGGGIVEVAQRNKVTL